MHLQGTQCKRELNLLLQVSPSPVNGSGQEHSNLLLKSPSLVQVALMSQGPDRHGSGTVGRTQIWQGKVTLMEGKSLMVSF